MWKLCRVLLAVVLVALLAQPALAQRQKQKQRQQGQRGQMGQGGVAALLKSEGVQKELKLDPDQVTKVKAAVQKVEDQHKDDLAKLKDAGREEQRSKGRELTQTISTETFAAVNDILKPEQMKRLKQIELQRAGEEAFGRPEVQKALNLTDTQRESLKTIAADAAKERSSLRSGGSGGQGNFEKLAALRKETNEKTQAILTDEQKKTWKELTGEPFQMQTRQRRPNQ